jgi:hypothetical protein
VTSCPLRVEEPCAPSRMRASPRLSSRVGCRGQRPRGDAGIRSSGCLRTFAGGPPMGGTLTTASHFPRLRLLEVHLTFPQHRIPEPRTVPCHPSAER